MHRYTILVANLVAQLFGPNSQIRHEIMIHCGISCIQYGLRYFFRPNWSLLGNANVWINAAAQNFNSLGIAFGSMISFASYNKYNNNFLHDTLAVSFINAITSLLVGIFAFATIGNIAQEQHTNVEDVISDGNSYDHFHFLCIRVI